MKKFVLLLVLALGAHMRAQPATAPPLQPAITASDLQFVTSWTFDHFASDSTTSATMSSNGFWVATGIEGHTIPVWDNSRLDATHESSEYQVIDRLLATGSLAIRTWDTTTWQLAWFRNPCHEGTRVASWTNGPRHLLLNCNVSVTLLRRIGDVSLSPPAHAALKPLPYATPPEPNAQMSTTDRQQLKLDLGFAITMAQARRLDELKRDPTKEISSPRTNLTGAEQCVIAVMSSFSKALSLECLYYYEHIEPGEIAELGQRAAPQLRWGDICGLLFSCGLDGSNNSIVMIGGKVRYLSSKRFSVTITEPR